MKAWVNIVAVFGLIACIGTNAYATDLYSLHTYKSVSDHFKVQNDSQGISYLLGADYKAHPITSEHPEILPFDYYPSNTYGHLYRGWLPSSKTDRPIRINLDSIHLIHKKEILFPFHSFW